MGWRSPSTDRALVPDLAEVLLVAIAVVLAAIVATMVFGFVDAFLDVGPTVAFAFEFAPGAGPQADCGDPAGDRLTITHETGDTLAPATVTIRGSSVPSANVDLDAACAGLGSGMKAGDSLSIAVQSSDTVRVVWQQEDTSAQIGVWEGPNA